MDVKKNPGADLEKEKTTYFLLGLIVALATLFVLLEWRTEQQPASPEWDGIPSVFIEEEYIGFNDLQTDLPEKEIPTPDLEEKIYEDYQIAEQNETMNNPTIVIPEEQTNTNEKDSGTEITENTTEDIIYDNPETLPEFPGGNIALNRFLFSHLKYPASAKTQRKEGRVWCSFVVNQDGSISNIKLEKSVYLSLDQEAIRVLRIMPQWKPGTISGQPARVKVYIPIVFKL